MEEMKLKYFRKIIVGIAFVLCILFFTLPLVQCTQDNSKTASGWEIATGTGDLYSQNGGGDPIILLLLIIPIILAILAILNKSFATLSYISISGLVAKIIFIIVAYDRINSDGAFELTSSNWLVIIIYIGLCIFTIYCKNIEYSKYMLNYVKKCIKCRQVLEEKTYECPYCRSITFYH
jgi:hypothetical protein